MRELRGGQRSDQWLVVKHGRISASCMGDLMCVGGPAKRRNYKMALIAERLTGMKANRYVSPEMEHGIEMEAEAISNYELATQEIVAPVGFVLHRTMDFAGASPDGLVGADGLIEVKCPKTETLLQWMDTSEIPDQYRYQIQWQLACTERKWCHFYGYDDRLPADCRHLVIRVDRDESMIATLEAEVTKINDEVESFIAKLGMPPTKWEVELKGEREPELDAGENGFDPASEAFDYLDAHELVP